MNTQKEYETNVFLNYPYEEQHYAIVDAMIFSSLACGFTPRSCEEEIGGLNQRIDRIVALVSDCRHGIHDLSSSMADDATSVRLNIPFELGIFYGAKRLGGEQHQTKQGFIFDERLSRNHSALSDTAGLDLQPHKRQPAIALVCIQRYFKKHASWPVLGPAALLFLFAEFTQSIPLLCIQLGLTPNDLSFEERRGLMSAWLSSRTQMKNTIF